MSLLSPLRVPGWEKKRYKSVMSDGGMGDGVGGMGDGVGGRGIRLHAMLKCLAYILEVIRHLCLAIGQQSLGPDHLLRFTM
ncbi:MAG: hypothetical protein JXB07_04920 [Anaerolineae bacterium]|nr:hypothetical protein [Anaerolineae bacterium]